MIFYNNMLLPSVHSLQKVLDLKHIAGFLLSFRNLRLEREHDLTDSEYERSICINEMIIYRPCYLNIFISGYKMKIVK